MRLIIPLAAFAVLLLAGCDSDSSPGPTPTPWPTPVFVEGECAFNAPAEITAVCGTVAVPQDRSDAESGTFDLAVAVYGSLSDDPPPEPLIYLAGGPGEEVLEALEFTFDDLFRPFLDDRDVIIFDQRGVGASEPAADCAELTRLDIDLLDDSLGIDDTGLLFIDAAKACFDRLEGEGVRLDRLTTAESAADVHAIARALGYQTWDLLGISYGTRLAQTVLRDRPEGVRAVILDSVVPLEVDLIAQTPASFDRGLQTLIDACAVDADCTSDYGDLEATLEAAIARLNAASEFGTVTNQLTHESYDAIATGNVLADQVFQGLYSSQVIPLLPEMIALAGTGEVGLLNLLRSVGVTNAGFLSTGMYLALQCQEEVPFTSESKLRDASEDLTRIRRWLEGSRPIGNELIATCNRWDLDKADGIENEPVVSDIPTLVLAGAFDPITPPAGGEAVADRLTNASFVLFPDAGHAALNSGDCAMEIAMAFLREPSAAVDQTCVDALPAISFVRPLGSVEFEPYESVLFGISGARPVGWAEVAPGAHARSEFGVVSMLQQLVPFTTGGDILTLLEASLPGGGAATMINTIRSRAYLWEVYEVREAGQLILFASPADLAPAPIIMVTGLVSQSQELIDHLLRPAIRDFARLP